VHGHAAERRRVVADERDLERFRLNLLDRDPGLD